MYSCTGTYMYTYCNKKVEYAALETERTKENHATKKQSSLNSNKELFKPSKILVKVIWQLLLLSEWTDQLQEVLLHDTCKRKRSQRDLEEEQIMFE